MNDWIKALLLQGPPRVDGAAPGFESDDVAVFLNMGQSNAAGVNGTAPLPAAVPSAYCMGADQRVWQPWSDTDFNCYSTPATKQTPAGALAEAWQARITAGEKLPDVYLLTVAFSGQGISVFQNGAAANRWNPVPPFLQSSADGPLTTQWRGADTANPPSAKSAYDVARKAIAAGVADLVGQGLNPRFMGLVWAQGERDCQTNQASTDYEELLWGIYSACVEASGAESIPFFPLELATLPDATYLYKDRLNDAFRRLATVDGRSLSIDPTTSPLWDPGVPQRGIFGGDQVHYTPDYLAWVAETVLTQTLDAGFYGYPVVKASAEQDWPAPAIWTQGTATVSPNPLNIGDAASGTLTVENLATNTNPGAVTNLAVTGSYSLDKTEVGPLDPGASDTVTVSVLATGAQTGVLTGDSTDGPFRVAVSSSLSYAPVTIPGFVDSYDARLITGVANGAVVPEFPARVGAAAQPDPTYNGATFVENAFGVGLHSVQFLGNSAQFRMDAAVRAALLATGEAEVWFVTNGVTTANGAEPFGIGVFATSTSSGLYTLGGSVFTNFAITSQQNLGAVPGGSAVYTNPHFARFYFRSNPGRVGVEVQGAAVGDTAATFGLNSVLYLPDRYGTGTFFNGDIGECVIFDRHLDPAEVSTMEAYMASAWGV